MPCLIPTHRFHAEAELLPCSKLPKTSFSCQRWVRSWRQRGMKHVSAGAGTSSAACPCSVTGKRPSKAKVDDVLTGFSAYAGHAVLVHAQGAARSAKAHLRCMWCYKKWHAVVLTLSETTNTVLMEQVLRRNMQRLRVLLSSTLTVWRSTLCIASVMVDVPVSAVNLSRSLPTGASACTGVRLSHRTQRAISWDMSR